MKNIAPATQQPLNEKLHLHALLIILLIHIAPTCSALEFYNFIQGNSNQLSFGIKSAEHKLAAAVGGVASHNVLDAATNFVFLCSKEYAEGAGTSNIFSIYAVQKASNYFMTNEASEFARYRTTNDTPTTPINCDTNNHMHKRIYYGITGWKNPQMVGIELYGHEYRENSTVDNVQHLAGGSYVMMRFESHGINEGFMTYHAQTVGSSDYYYINEDKWSIPVDAVSVQFEHYSWGTNFPTSWDYTNTWATNVHTHTNDSPFVTTNAKSELVQMQYIARIVALTNFTLITNMVTAPATTNYYTNSYLSGSNYYGFSPQTETTNGGYFRVKIGDPEISSGVKDIKMQDSWPTHGANLQQWFETPNNPGIFGTYFSRPEGDRPTVWYGTNGSAMNAQGVTYERYSLTNLVNATITNTNGSPGPGWVLVAYLDTFEVTEASPSLSDYLSACGYSAIDDPATEADQTKIVNFCFQIASKLGTWLERKEIWQLW